MVATPQVPETNKAVAGGVTTTDAAPKELLSIPGYLSFANKIAIGLVKAFLLAYYGDRPYARFAALETIARVPYFSYTSVLHLYETLGWHKKKQYIQLHFAESWNELHHLLIMEELGGSKEFSDRIVAQVIAIAYYWIVVLAYMIAPAYAYNLNKNVESHAYDTYNAFLNDNEAMLKKEPAPQVAKDYYERGDLTLFDAFHSYQLDANGAKTENSRRPTITNLYDVFYNIREDEKEHCETMVRLEDEVLNGSLLEKPKE